ncbi:lipid kinase [Kineosporia rhizophila]|uniref:lipid kinase n=1 Tax=Kineosporia TaxID=49184 RepID=UPI001E35F998|nr:lipid kinase [Kineosporia sp. NBRC 101677]MCE0536684.1 lipid kinase [Kineosporia rhizophila]GLY13170.1 lipid kinase [Kineosporia sp. NBRC 101677]
MIESPAVLIVNSASRRGQEDFERARESLSGLGVELQAAHAVDDPSTLPSVVSQAIAEGARTIILGGGDGTVSSVAPQLCETGVVLGLLPTGTANDLARTLGLPTDLIRACENVAAGKVVDVDLGVVGDDRFLNVSSIGLAVGVTRQLNPKLKKRLGALAYPVATVKAYRRFKTFSARLEFPDGDHPDVELDDLLQLAVANGRFYGGGAVVAPGAGIDDHLLDVYAIPRGTPLQRWQVARHFVSGHFTESDHVYHVTTRRVRVSTTPDHTINVDGELSARTPEVFGIIQGGLRVIVPEDATVGVADVRARQKARS